MAYKHTFNRDYNYLAHFNKNHDPKNGRFTFGDGDGDGIYGKANPNDYRTPELDKKYSELKKTGATEVENLKWLHNDDDAEKVWGKDYVKSATIGMNALNKSTSWDDSEILDFIEGKTDNAHKNMMLNWFVFEDQTPGYMEIAVLVNNGWSKEKIMDMIRTCDYDFMEKNSEFENAYTGYPNNKDWGKLFTEAFKKGPYPGTYSLGETLQSGTDKYIDACIEAKNELEHSGVDNMDYLIHYNKNHSKANGQFISGDGDGDGIADDHAHRSGNKNKTAQTPDRYSERDWKKGVKVAGTALGVTAAIAGAAFAGYKIYQKFKSKPFSDEELHDIGITLPKIELAKTEVAKIDWAKVDVSKIDFGPDWNKNHANIFSVGSDYY